MVTQSNRIEGNQVLSLSLYSRCVITVSINQLFKCKRRSLGGWVREAQNAEKASSDDFEIK